MNILDRIIASRRLEISGSIPPEKSGRATRPAIKVCGITSEEDARVCGELGVDLIGFNFSPESPRAVSPEQARRIVDAVRPRYPALRFVGVFVNQEIVPGFHAVQLHGEETPDAVAKVQAPFVIKALRVGDDFELDAAEAYACDALLLDTFHPATRGGTGECFDWSIARALVVKGRRVILAGGLNHGNIVEAIAVVQPFAVDVCSGVEREPGRKDARRLRQFVEAIR